MLLHGFGIQTAGFAVGRGCAGGPHLRRDACAVRCRLSAGLWSEVGLAVPLGLHASGPALRFPDEYDA